MWIFCEVFVDNSFDFVLFFIDTTYPHYVVRILLKLL